MHLSANEKNNVHQAYEVWSESYDRQTNPTRDLSSAVVKLHFNNELAGTIVEAGCGTGINTVWLAKRCAKLIGLDFSASMLTQARQKVSKLDKEILLFEHDLNRPWPVESGSADAVLLNLVLEHMSDLQPIMSEVSRVLGAHGRLLITEYHPARVEEGKGAQIESGEAENGDGDESSESTYEIINFLHPLEEYRQLASEFGFESMSINEWREQLSEDGRPLLFDNATAEEGERPLVVSIEMLKTQE